MREFKSFYKTVTAAEGDRCKYPTRLDVYGCGCQHDCSYCYAKSLLDFRGLWHPDDPSIADIDKIRRKLDYEYWRKHINPNKEDCCNLRR